MSESDLTIIQKMRALADSGHERAAELREKADALDTVCKEIARAWEERGKIVVKLMLGAWLRARILRCDITGEDLA